MRKLSGRSLVCGICVAACVNVSYAQFGRGDSTWATSGADAQRSSWVRSDPKISKEGVQKADFRFLWKQKLGDSASQSTTTLTPAVLLTRYIGYRGFRNLALVQSNSDKVYGIDVDLGRIEWTAPLKVQGSAGSCSDTLTAGLARATVTAFPSGSGTSGFGRGGPAHSSVGEPGEGGVTLRAGQMNPRPQPPAPPAVAPGAPRAPGGSNAPAIPGSGGAMPVPRRSPIVMHVVGADGMVHSMYVSNGIESESPVEFLPPGSAAKGFIVLNNVAYAASVGCSGGGSGIRALDLTSKQVTKWDTTAEVAGSEGPAFGPDGTVFVATSGGEMLALDGKTLEVKDKYAAKQPFITSPVVFQYRQRVLAVAETKDGSLHLVDTKSLGGSDGQTPLAKTAGLPSTTSLVPGALASYQDVGGRRWILSPVAGQITSEANFSGNNGPVAKGAIATWQIAEQNGALSLVPGWISRDMSAPSTPMVVNGVVFAASTGSGEVSSKSVRGSSPAVVFALDGSTGKEIWNSGKSITASAHHGSLSAGGSQIYFGTDDGMLYAFGSWIERQ